MCNNIFGEIKNTYKIIKNEITKSNCRTLYLDVTKNNDESHYTDINCNNNISYVCGKVNLCVSLRILKI